MAHEVASGLPNTVTRRCPANVTPATTYHTTKTLLDISFQAVHFITKVHVFKDIFNWPADPLISNKASVPDHKEFELGIIYKPVQPKEF